MTPQEIADELTDILRTPTGTMSLFPVQGRVLMGLVERQKAFTNQSVGGGKAQPVDEPVLTPAGWVPIGNLRHGDYVIGSQGTPVKVLSVHPQGMRNIAKVVFSDRTEVRCDWEHLWTFRRAGDRRTGHDAVWCSPKRTGSQQDIYGSCWHTRTLREWVDTGIARMAGKHKAHKWFVPIVEPIERPWKELPLDPYTLGALLGDGCLKNTPSFTSMDADIVTRLRLPDGVTLKERPQVSNAREFYLTGGVRKRKNPLTKILEEIGVYGKTSEAKFVPKMYLTAHVQQRLELLQGLLDTDGTTADAANGIEYSTLSTQLAEDVAQLVRELGGTCTLGTLAANGNARLHIKLPRRFPAFYCKRKGEPYTLAKKRQREPYKALVRVEDAGEAECVCICVDAVDSLYVTKGHTLTHNTLAFALAMTVCGGSNPVIMTESSNIPQMRKDFEGYRAHWKIPTIYQLRSYEELSNNPELLNQIKPTFLGLDEAHKVKAVKDSARGRRVDRWRLANPDTPMLVASGSPGNAFRDYAHLMLWVCPELSEANGGRVPVDDTGRPSGKDFRRFCRELEEDDAALLSFLRWVHSHPEIIISSDTYTGTPLRITHTILPTPPEMEEHWERLRVDGEAPDGWFLEGPAEQWGLARLMSNGLYYEHIPRPPEDYRQARKEWYKFVRELKDQEDRAPGGPWDTEGQVAKGVLAGVLPSEQYRAWMRLKPTYTPKTRTTWLSDQVVEYAIEWGMARAHLADETGGGSIVWVAYTGLGDEIAKRAGWKFFSDGAKSECGQMVQNAKDPVIICSVHSCGTGKNLQHRYSRNLFTSPHSNNDEAEQNLGRCHRHGQRQDLVEAEYLYCCLEDWMAMKKAEREAAQYELENKAKRKLLLAQHVRAAYPKEDQAGFAWKKANDTGDVVVEVGD